MASASNWVALNFCGDGADSATGIFSHISGEGEWPSGGMALSIPRR